MFVGLAVFFGRADSVTGFSALDASAIYQLILACLTAFLLFFIILAYPSIIKFFFNPGLFFLTGYATLGIITAAFSPTPEISLYKALLIFIDCVMVCATFYYLVKKNLDPHIFLRLCYFLSSVFVFGALVGALIKPQAGLLPSKGALGIMLCGTYPNINSNELGFLAAIVLVSSLCGLARSRDFHAKYFWFSQSMTSVIVLFLAQARTALVSTFLALAILSLGIRKLRIALCILSFLILTHLGYKLVTGEQLKLTETLSAYAQRGQSDSGLQSIKGRAELWTSSGLQMFKDAPFFGHGFDAGVRYGGSKYGLAKTHMHNSHFQILSNSGFFGYLTWLAFVVLVSLHVLKFFTLRNKYGQNGLEFILGYELVAILIIILLRSMTGQVLVTHQWSLMIFLGLFICSRTMIDRYKTINSDSRVATATR
jgi:O-antigen ligase